MRRLLTITRPQFEKNMDGKLEQPEFKHDTVALLRPEISYEPMEAWQRVHEQLVCLLP